MPDFNPDQYLAEKTAAAAPAAAFDPDRYLAEKTAIPPPAPAPPSLGAKALDAAKEAYGGVKAFLGGDGGGPIMENAPIVGPLAKQAGQRFRAGVNYLVDKTDKPFADELAGVRAEDQAEADRFAQAHPMADYARKMVGGLGAVAVPFPGAGLSGLSGAAVRVGGALTGAGTDAALRTGDAAQVRQAATIGGGLQTALEAVPYAGRLLAPVGRTLGGIASPLAEWLGTKAANVIGGVDEGNFGKYLANRERINAAGALEPEAVKDAVDTGVAGLTSDRDALAGEAGGLEDRVNQAYAKKQAELVGQTTPLSKAKELAASLQSQKAYLGSLSEQADDALVRSGAVFQKSDLLAAVDKIGTGKGVAIGDEAHAALSKLQTTRDRIEAQLPDQIPATQMRDVLQQLRKDVSFDQGAGEFNDTLNGIRKEFSGQISKALKDATTVVGPDGVARSEYADYMSRMSDLSQNLSTMNRYFGDEGKALGSLETLRRGGPRAQLIQDALQNHATVNADQSMLDQLSEIDKSHALLARIKGGEDLRGEFFPNEMRALQEAQANAQMGQEVAAPVERLGQNRTQAVIRNQGGTVPNIEDRRALEALSAATGENYPQMIEDKNVFDSFGKASPGGARRAAAGAAIGGAVGHFVGAPLQGAAVGSAIGGTLDRYGPAITKGTVDAGANLANWLAGHGGSVQELGDMLRRSPAALAAPVFIQDPQQQRRDAIQRRIGK